MGAFVGIDLGTTYSAIAYINANGEAEVIKNEDGKAVTPSIVDLSVEPPLVGLRAKEKQAAGETQIASFFKTMMHKPETPLYFGARQYTPVDFSAYVLSYLKCYAEDFLRQPVTDAVITVPAYFGNNEREATIRAGQQAGLNVLGILNEPSAAALAYKAGPGMYLIYDLGGGTFDVSIVRLSSSEIEVIASLGEHELGGKDWDDRILHYLADQFKEEFGEELVGENLNELRVKAENAKISLSSRQRVEAVVQGSGKQGKYELTRDKFNELTASLMEQTRFVTEKTLAEANQKTPCNWSILTGVLLVGGSTRMPMVRDYVTEMTGRPPLVNINPDEAVALGAAIHASQLMADRGEPVYRLSGAPIKDITAHSLGMIAESADRSKYVNSIIITRQTAIPVISSPRSYSYQTTSNLAKNRLEIFVTQGEGTDPLSTTLNYLELRVATDIPHVPNGTARIEVTYGYNRNGVVEVTALESTTGKTLPIHSEALPSDVPARFGRKPEVVPVREPMTVYIAIDLSGSMGGDPLVEAQRAALGFVRDLKPGNGIQLGLISVADRTQVDQEATENEEAMHRAISGMRIGQVGYGNAGHPFHEINKLLSQAKGRRLAIVLADGVWSHQGSAVDAAHRCHRAGVEIIGICFGDADEKFMRDISSAGQESLKAGHGQLEQAFSTIARELNSGGLRSS